jgi:hypothetical protein
MPGISNKCKNKFCQEQGAHRPSDKVKVAEMLNARVTSDIRLCMDCKDLFDLKKEYSSNEKTLRHCNNVLTRINTEIALVVALKTRVLDFTRLSLQKINEIKKETKEAKTKKSTRRKVFACLDSKLNNQLNESTTPKRSRLSSTESEEEENRQEKESQENRRQSKKKQKLGSKCEKENLNFPNNMQCHAPNQNLKTKSKLEDTKRNKNKSNPTKTATTATNNSTAADLGKSSADVGIDDHTGDSES